MSALVKSFATEDEVTNWAIDWLRARSFSVFEMGREPWATPADLARRHGLTTKRIFGRLHHAKCPQTPRRDGPSGRLRAVLVTPELTRWLEASRR
jgi:hypothetical protein